MRKGLYQKTLLAAAFIISAGCAAETGTRTTTAQPAAAAKHTVPDYLEQVTKNEKTLTETKQCANCDLRGAHLAEADLVGADLSGANLEGAHLAGANLHGANLSNANLKSANLPKANLSNANLAGAKLDHANVLGAYLTGATGLTHEQKIYLTAAGAKVY